jgi:hypothetical protein
MKVTAQAEIAFQLQRGAALSGTVSVSNLRILIKKIA